MPAATPFMNAMDSVMPATGSFSFGNARRDGPVWDIVFALWFMMFTRLS